MSNTRRTIQMHQMPGNMGGTYVSEIKATPENKNKSTYASWAFAQSVQTILLDDLVSIIPVKRAIMKLDIEGHEIVRHRWSRTPVQGNRYSFGPLLVFSDKNKSKKDEKYINAFLKMFYVSKSRNYELYDMKGTIFH